MTDDWLLVMRLLGKDWVLKNDAEQRVRRARFRPIVKPKKAR